MNIMNTSKELEQWSKNHKQIADLPFELLKKAISLCRIFGSKSIYLLHYRDNANALTMIAHIEDTWRS